MSSKNRNANEPTPRATVADGVLKRVQPSTVISLSGVLSFSLQGFFEYLCFVWRIIPAKNIFLPRHASERWVSSGERSFLTEFYSSVP